MAGRGAGSRVRAATEEGIPTPNGSDLVFDIAIPPSAGPHSLKTVQRSILSRGADTTDISVPCIQCIVATKTIALDTETYELLRRQKRPGETFSQTLQRELRPPQKISDLAGSLKDIPSSTWQSFEKTRRAARKRDDERHLRLAASLEHA